jgi:hypothetical protein
MFENARTVQATAGESAPESDPLKEVRRSAQRERRGATRGRGQSTPAPSIVRAVAPHRPRPRQRRRRTAMVGTSSCCFCSFVSNGPRDPSSNVQHGHVVHTCQALHTVNRRPPTAGTTRVPSHIRYEVEHMHIGVEKKGPTDSTHLAGAGATYAHTCKLARSSSSTPVRPLPRFFTAADSQRRHSHTFSTAPSAIARPNSPSRTRACRSFDRNVRYEVEHRGENEESPTGLDASSQHRGHVRAHV